MAPRSTIHIRAQERRGVIECLSGGVELFNALLKNVLHAGPFLQRHAVTLSMSFLSVTQRVVVKNLVRSDLDKEWRKPIRDAKQRRRARVIGQRRPDISTCGFA